MPQTALEIAREAENERLQEIMIHAGKEGDEDRFDRYDVNFLLNLIEKLKKELKDNKESSA